MRLVALANRRTLRLWAGDYAPAREDLTLAANLVRSADLDYLALYCLSNFPDTYTATNEFTHARRSAEEVIAVASQRGWGGSARLVYSYGMVGYTAVLMLDPVSAAERAAQGLEVLGTTVDAEADGAARSGEAVIAFDDPTQRRAAMARLQATTAWLTTVGASPALIAMPAQHDLRMCLRLGERAMAEHAIARAHRRLADVADVAVMRGHPAYARGRNTDARRYLRPVLDGRDVPVSSTALTTAWLIDAVMAARPDRQAGVDQALRAALAHAAPTHRCWTSLLRCWSGAAAPSATPAGPAGSVGVLPGRDLSRAGPRGRVAGWSLRRATDGHPPAFGHAHRTRGAGASRAPVHADIRQDRCSAVRQHQHREDPRSVDLRQARGVQSSEGGRGGTSPGHRLIGHRGVELTRCG